jgi:hypothetical protein
MNIYIDESGSFAYSSQPNSWCVVASYVIPETDEQPAFEALRHLKVESNASGSEIKLSDVDEDQFSAFLRRLESLEGTFHAVATDSSLNRPEIVKKHQEMQGLKIVEHIDKMKFEEGRQAVRAMRDRIEGLSPQLYVQLTCQFMLLYKTVHTMIPYYAQRNAKSLSRFCWRVDQKNLSKTQFEEAFEMLGPPILQTLSFSDPLIMIEGIDYSAMKDFLYTKDTAPKYLKDVYGQDTSGGGVNIQKLIRDEIDFVDSKNSEGVQIVDLLVSGLRRCLRMQWRRNKRIAHRIGALMVQAANGDPPIQLLGLSDNKRLRNEVATVVKHMQMTTKPFLQPSLFNNP